MNVITRRKKYSLSRCWKCMATALNAVSYANNKSANIDAENISTIVIWMVWMVVNATEIEWSERIEKDESNEVQRGLKVIENNLCALEWNGNDNTAENSSEDTNLCKTEHKYREREKKTSMRKKHVRAKKYVRARKKTCQSEKSTKERQQPGRKVPNNIKKSPRNFK